LGQGEYMFNGSNDIVWLQISTSQSYAIGITSMVLHKPKSFGVHPKMAQVNVRISKNTPSLYSL
jgi:hypothetical protein